MTDERMTQGDVRLRDALAAAVHNEVLLRVACRDTRWEDWTDIADALAPVVERIVAARVGEALMHERATRAVAIAEWERANGVPFTTLEDALRAADAPLSDDEGSGGRGDAGGDERL